MIKAEGVVDVVGRMVPDGVVLWWTELSSGQVWSVVIIGLVVLVGLWMADHHMKRLMMGGESGV